jgi:hypothetical protein
MSALPNKLAAEELLEIPLVKSARLRAWLLSRVVWAAGDALAVGSHLFHTLFLQFILLVHLIHPLRCLMIPACYTSKRRNI